MPVRQRSGVAVGAALGALLIVSGCARPALRSGDVLGRGKEIHLPGDGKARAHWELAVDENNTYAFTYIAFVRPPLGWLDDPALFYAEAEPAIDLSNPAVDDEGRSYVLYLSRFAILDAVRVTGLPVVLLDYSEEPPRIRGVDVELPRLSQGLYGRGSGAAAEVCESFASGVIGALCRTSPEIRALAEGPLASETETR